jgi:2-polyprenyl-6-methoxyphenol hydroxylase-like FAD-dependent oxidoreductase
MEISIIGGGITGLTTALALHKLGLPSTVYEQAPVLNEIGAGVWLQPNAMRVLKWLGVDKAISAEGCTLNKMEITYPNLKPIKAIKNAVVADRYGNQTIAIHRSKLQALLYEEFSKVGNIALGAPYLSHHTDGQKIVLQLQGQTITTDVVLGADGIRSRVRQAIHFPSVYRSSGQICCRGIANTELPHNLQHEGKEVWGNKLRFGFSQLSQNTVYFFAVINAEICPEQLNSQSLCALYQNFHPVVTQIIDASGPMHIAELTDLKRLQSWHNGQVCLLGDAAHATTPNMGQGACQGIEDAYYLSHMLKNEPEDVEVAFAKFEHKRRKKVDFVVNNSWQFGKMVHNPVGQLIMRSLMKLTPEKTMSQQMNKLYDIEKP